jgi:uncharacterized OsmC-like protein
MVKVWGGYGTPFKTDGGAYCQAAWCSCTTMRVRMLLPERKQCFKSLAGKFLNIYSRLGPKWFSVVPKIEGILNGLVAEVYDEGIQKLVTRYDKCLNAGGDYVEK